MFKKPIRVKSNNQLKGSERKSLKDDVCKTFPSLNEDTELNNLFNNKKVPINCVKIVTHTNNQVQVYLVDKKPLFFSLEAKKIYPTVLLLWKYPNLLSSFTTHPQVVNFITSGADLMLPGVVTPPTTSGLSKFNNLQQGDTVFINTSANKAAFAVGEAAQSSFDMERANSKGKCVFVYHFYGDHLCNIENSATLNLLPNFGPENWLIPNIQNEQDFPALLLVVPVKLEELTINEDIPQVELSKDEPIQNDDDLLHYCFMAAIKYSKNIQLPLLISNFFKLQMLPVCPEGLNLDVKKTSYKKLKPFLDEMNQIGLITIKELKKGCEAITEINKNHPKFNEFYIKPEQRRKQGPKNDNNEENTNNLIVTESYVITANNLVFFQQAGYKKGDILDAIKIRTLISDYIKFNNSVAPENTRLIQPNTEALKLLCKTENPISWEEMFEKLFDSMKSCFKVKKSSNKEEIFNKGKITPIIMSVATRSGNKKVTLVDNLENFAININEFSKECQHGVGASTSITPTPPGKKCDQLLVQGNQILFIHNLLMEKYKIPKKYIRGLELAPKRKK